ncbi:MAG: two-component system, response regulator PdtaR [Thermoleophilaceae bacterium]|nr:two-component system, response regulator PdtaR [Thermoleophilaceae bacterium]
MAPPEQQPLRVLIANEDRERLTELSDMAEGLGLDVVAREVAVTEIAAAARELMPDVAIVGLHDHHAEHALGLIEQVVREGVCPVIAVTGGDDAQFVANAAAKGIFAHTNAVDADALLGTIDIALKRFGHAAQLEGALGRRALIERAKGVLMERYSLDESAAFDRLRTESRHSGQKVVEVSEALLRSHSLLREPPS